jgi:copper(I)-binding protein
MRGHTVFQLPTVIRRPILVLLGLSLLLGAVLAACSSGGGVSVQDPKVQVTVPSAPAAAYMVLVNSSGTADALVGASSPAYKTVELHETRAGASMEPESMAPMGSESPGASMEPESMAPMGSESPGASMGESMVGMYPVSSIPIPANGSQTLQPGGYHLMLMDPVNAPAVGDKVELDLTFQNAGKVTVQAAVVAP